MDQKNINFLSWRHVSNLGIRNLSAEEAGPLRVFNQIVVISLLIFLSFIPIAGIVASWMYFFIILSSAFILFLNLLLNQSGYFALSKHMFLLILILSITLMSMVLGPESMVYLSLIPIASLSLLFFNSIHLSLLHLSLSLAMLVLALNDISLVEKFEMPAWKSDLVRYCNVVGVIVVGYYYNVFYKKSSDQKDKRYISINRKIEERNREILKNIEIARNMQANLLPYDSQFQSMFPESFVFYEPRDLVSGDFYWIDKVGGRKYCAVIDCTGHGVPGAFVSVLGHQALNRCVNDLGIKKAAEILNHLHESMYQVLHKDDSLILDGMDMSMISYDPMTSVLSFCGAVNSILLIRSNELEMPDFELEYKGINHSLFIIKAQKQSVGADNLQETFVEQHVKIEDGDRIYMYTDGYVDQFGGPAGKKLMHKAFRKLLLSIQDLPMKDQEKEVRDYFEEWKGETDQIDDVCIVGLELKNEY